MFSLEIMPFTRLILYASNMLRLQLLLQSFFSSLPRFSLAVLCASGLGGACHAGEVTLGHISSLTNPSSADNSKQLRAGIQLAFDASNAAGGVNGNTLKMVTKDDALDAKKMVEMTTEMIADPAVIGLVGFLNTGGLTALAATDFFGKNDIALVAPYQGNQNIVQATNVFPFRSGYNAEVTTIVKEAQATFKQNLAVVYYNIAFGPPVSKFAQEQAALSKMPLLAALEIDAKPGGDLAGSIARAIAELQRIKPEAILLVAAGKASYDFIAAVRKSNVSTAQLYGMSVIVPDALVAAVGEKAARGVVLSQATPYPFVATSRLVSEYHRALRELSPNQPRSFSHMEGFAVGKIAIAALKKAGNKPTRQSFINALNSLGTYDLGGPSVLYSSQAKRGWGGVELVIFGRDGKLIR